MPKKNNSEPKNTAERSRTTAPAKPASRRQTAKSASPARDQSNDDRIAFDGTPELNTTVNGDDDVTDGPRYEEIAEAAYLRFLSRGCQDGRDFDDWVEAERDLRERRSR